jgi:class 3 adenylate cyclase
MSELPTGTVTLLFTDVEGATSLIRQVGDRHGEILDGVAAAVAAQRAVASHNCPGNAIVQPQDSVLLREGIAS